MKQIVLKVSLLVVIFGLNAPKGLVGQCPVNVDILQGASAWFCPGDTFILSGTPGLLNYAWSNGLTSDTIRITSPGTYWVSTTGPMAACMDWDTIQVFQYPYPPQVQLNITGNYFRLCEGAVLNVAITNPSYTQYFWNYDGSNSTKIDIDSAGFFWAVAWDANGCRDSSNTFTVQTIPNPVPNLGTDSTICSADSINLSPGNFFFNYVWSTGDSADNVWIENAGQVWVEVTDADGCKGRDSISISEKPSPIIDLGPDTIICVDSNYPLDASVPGGTYFWQDGAVDPIYFVNASGQYWVRVTASNACISPVDSVWITVDSPIVPIITSSLSLLSVPQDQAHLWYLNGMPIPGATAANYRPLETGEYQVSSTNANGCIIFSEILLWEAKIKLIQAFTPNGDGMGDYFFIENIDLFPKADLKVFNRWGTLVYEMAAYNNSWNGNSREGIELPVGTYYFTLDLQDGGKAITDFVVINR